MLPSQPNLTQRAGYSMTVVVVEELAGEVMTLRLSVVLTVEELVLGAGSSSSTTQPERERVATAITE